MLIFSGLVVVGAGDGHHCVAAVVDEGGGAVATAGVEGVSDLDGIGLVVTGSDGADSVEVAAAGVGVEVVGVAVGVVLAAAALVEPDERAVVIGEGLV